MDDAALRALLRDCLVLWDVSAQVRAAETGGVVLTTQAGALYTVTAASPAQLPMRWLLQTPARAAAGRPPRAAASIVALLSALRAELCGGRGARLRVAG
jgi:hypothetical protein